MILVTQIISIIKCFFGYWKKENINGYIFVTKIQTDYGYIRYAPYIVILIV